MTRERENEKIEDALRALDRATIAVAKLPYSEEFPLEDAHARIYEVKCYINKMKVDLNSGE